LNSPLINALKTLTLKETKMKKFDYNLIVIGGGTAGLITANVAAQAKAKVALVERHLMGGDCLNTGCVPSKALIASAKLAHHARRAEEFGIKINGTIEVDFPKIMGQVQGIIDYIAPIDSRERYTSLGCDCYEDQATILSKHEVKIGTKSFSTAHIVIASGATPIVPKVPGLENIKVLTSDNLWAIRTLPKRLLVVGSGPIGCELAQAFARLGSEVTIVSNSPTILVREDADVAAHVQAVFVHEGVKLHLSAEMQHFTSANGAHRLELKSNDKVHHVDFDEVLVAVGRRANTQGLGLENIGIAFNDNGTVKVDAYQRTSAPNIWACGDVSGPYQFTHMAAHQAGYVAMNILASPLKKFAVDYSQVPWVTYTDPEIARVGLNENEARQKNIAFDVALFHLSHQDRAITERESKGFVKILTAPGSDRILGATIVGAHAGELLAEFNLAVKNKLGLKAILNTIHPYPTFSEANKSAANEWRKKSIPLKLLPYAQKYFARRRG
jgi:dihydrolipoamide dehydrogenase